jgi:hypothetical protein
MTPVELAIASAPDKARTIPRKSFQFSQNPPSSGFRWCHASPTCCRQKSPRIQTTITVGIEKAIADCRFCRGLPRPKARLRTTSGVPGADHAVPYSCAFASSSSADRLAINEVFFDIF